MSRVTVIIPVLNAMPYLTEALASLQGQTSKDFEVCLWDNGSTDGSVKEAQRWLPGRLKGRVVIGNQLPLHECLARMVEEAQTEFVARMDGDDICLPERFELQLEEMQRNPKLAALGAQRLEIDAQGSSLPAGASMPVAFVDVLSRLLVVNALLHPTVMFRRLAILSAGNYGLCEKPCEDYDLWLRVAQKFEFRNSERVLLKYRVHEGGIIMSARRAEALAKPNLDCICRHVQELFGIDPVNYRRLRNKQVALVFPILLKAAGKISTRTGARLSMVLGSSEFLYSARCLTRKGDLASRALWGVFERVLSHA
jgi:glycosyltransferase involved in cell wall biosynthesis